MVCCFLYNCKKSLDILKCCYCEFYSNKWSYVRVNVFNVLFFYNDGLWDWKNMFVMMRFYYIGVFFYLVYYYWCEECCLVNWGVVK